jgi:hypothetical protein
VSAPQIPELMLEHRLGCKKFPSRRPNAYGFYTEEAVQLLTILPLPPILVLKSPIPLIGLGPRCVEPNWLWKASLILLTVSGRWQQCTMSLLWDAP